MRNWTSIFTMRFLVYFLIAVTLISSATYAIAAHAQTEWQGYGHGPARHRHVKPTVTATPARSTVTVTATSTRPAVTPTSTRPAATATPTSSAATPTPTQTTGGTSTGPVACTSGCWLPTLNTTFQWQLQGTVDQSYAASLYDIDGFDNSSTVVSELHSAGHKVACYIDAGTWENWRSDASEFPASVEGASNGWPGEKWLDIRQLTILGPLMLKRINMCKAKGFDAIEFDNVDGYSNDTGFTLTAKEQLTYNEWLANQAHAQGMAVFLKNDTDQVSTLLPYFDGEIDEQCFQYQECDTLVPFITAGKPVFEVEYNLKTSQFCPQANSMKFFAQLKNIDLGAARTLCRPA